MEKKQRPAAKTLGESFSPGCSASSPGQERKQGLRALLAGAGLFLPGLQGVMKGEEG